MLLNYVDKEYHVTYYEYCNVTHRWPGNNSAKRNDTCLSCKKSTDYFTRIVVDIPIYQSIDILKRRSSP